MKRRAALIFAFCVLLVAGVLAVAAYTGAWQFNAPPESRYPVRGIDVSHYQGDIDWSGIASRGIAFAFIKATEGSSYTDAFFVQNAAGASGAGIVTGAYHFFSFESSGVAQAEHYIATVGDSVSLPAVIDVELYGDYTSSPPDAGAVRTELSAMIDTLYAHYGTMPILYVTNATYNRYVAGACAGCPVWIRSLFGTPALPDGGEWEFWQYSNRGLRGLSGGREKYIDLNVFNGSVDEWKNKYAK